MIDKIDGFLIDRCQSTLDLLNDWVGIEQRKLERGLIYGYGVFTVPILVSACYQKHSTVLIFFLVICHGLLIGTMCLDYHKSSESRKFDKHSGGVFRIIWVYIFICATLLILPPLHGWRYDVPAVCISLCDFMRLCMYYVVICNVDGEKRKAARLSLSKLKGMFGTEWIPKPVSVGA